jgi:hypothetical protein
VDALGKIAVAVDMVVIADTIDAHVHHGDIFARIEQLHFAVHLTVRGGQHPVVFGAVGVAFAKLARVGDGGEGGGEGELAGEDLIGAAARLGARDFERIAFDGDAKRAILSQGDTVGADTDVRRIAAFAVGGVDVQKLSNLFSALVDRKVGGRIMAHGETGGHAGAKTGGARPADRLEVMGVEGQSVKQGHKHAIASGRQSVEAPPFICPRRAQGLTIFLRPSLLSGGGVEPCHPRCGTGARIRRTFLRGG